MLQELKLPELGENIHSAVVGAVLVSAGDTIAKDQPVVEVETDKATAEVPSTLGGIVREVRVQQGEEIRVGHVILTVEVGGGGKSERSAPVRAATTAGAPSSPEKAEPAREAAAPERKPRTPSPIDIPAAPAVRRLAREIGVAIGEVRGTGAGGRISSEDVKEHAHRVIAEGAQPVAPATVVPRAGEEPPLPDFSRWGAIRREPLSAIRRRTAENLAQAWATVPHVTQFDEADITALESTRRRWRRVVEEAGGKLTITAIILKVVASALVRFPRINASLDMLRREIVYKDYVHVGVAVDTPHGLLVPVVRDTDHKSILALAVELGALSEKARGRKLTVDEMSGASFTVTNLGGLGTTHFSPIVNWPQAAILGVGRATDRAVPLPGRFEARRILPLSVSYDHRLIDGADAARFLRWIAETLEEPLDLSLKD